MSDLVRCLITFSVFPWNPILWAMDNKFCREKRGKLYNFSPNIQLFLRLLIKLNLFSNYFPLILSNRPYLFSALEASYDGNRFNITSSGWGIITFLMMSIHLILLTQRRSFDNIVSIEFNIFKSYHLPPSRLAHKIV